MGFPKIWIMLNLLFVLLLLKGVACIKVIRQSDNTTSWTLAQKDCVSQGGDLLLLNEESIKAIERCNYSSTDVFWDGRYNTFSSWVIYKGCVHQNDSEIESQRHLQTPGSVECAEYCRAYTYFGIQNETCFCFKPSFSVMEWDDVMCSIKCSLRGEPCGGQDFISVYQEVSAREVRPREDDIQPFEILCGLVECTPPNWKLYGYPCGRSLKAICNDDEVLLSNQKWSSSQDNCWQTRNRTLGGINVVNRISCITNYQHINTPLWVQMRRDKVTRTVGGVEVVPESTCFGGLIDNGTFIERDMDCNHQHKYVCVIDTDSPNCTDCPFNEGDIIPPCPETTESYTSTMSTDSIMSTDQQDESSTLSVTSEKIKTSAAPVQSNDNAEDLRAGAIVGGTVGGVVGLLLVLFLIRRCLRQKKQQQGSGERYISDEFKKDGIQSNMHDSTIPQNNTINELDISKDSTMLIRPTFQPPKQTDCIHDECLANPEPTEEVGFADRLEINETPNMEDNELNQAEIHKFDEDNSSIKSSKVIQANQEMTEQSSDETVQSLHENVQQDTNSNLKSSTRSENESKNEKPNGTESKDVNPSETESEEVKPSETESKEEGVMDDNQEKSTEGSLMPVMTLSKHNEEKLKRDKPKMVSVINIGPIAKSDVVTQL